MFAGVLTFKDGLKIVKVRAESMAAAATQGSSLYCILTCMPVCVMLCCNLSFVQV